jgi:small subunit ribosomal protein S1
MSEQDDFAAMLEASMGGQRAVRLRNGQRVEGTVVQIGRDVVFLDVGTRSEGRVARHELEDDQGALRVSLGDRIHVTVARASDPPELVFRLGRGGAVDVAALEAAAAAGTAVEGEVQRAVKGGLEVTIAGRRAFCPVSQIDRQYTADPSVYEGQTLRFRVLEVRENGRNIVLSRRALLEAERFEASRELIERLETGATVEGKVTSIKDYGAFVDIGGVEGLVHISELGHGRVGSVSDVVSVGESVTARVLGMEGEGAELRIKLSLKALTQAPAKRDAQKISDAKVVKVEPFGVVVETEDGGGVVPTRELELPPGGDPRRAYPVGKAIRVVSIGTDTQGRPRFSVRRVADAEARANFREFRKAQDGPRDAGALGSFGELLKSKLDD